MENPFVDMRQFHAQNSRLYSVETGIQTDILMTIFYALSMACKSFDLFGKLPAVGKHGTAVAITTKNFTREKRSAAYCSDCARKLL